MADDFYAEAFRARMQQISAERAAALADLEAAKLNGDHGLAGTAEQNIADLDAAAGNLQNLAQRYVASQNPPQPPEPSKEERAARPWNRMDWEDVANLARTSKYARNIRSDDPGLVAGWNEAQRRRQRGE
jgi:hypothetical protein